MGERSLCGGRSFSSTFIEKFKTKTNFRYETVFSQKMVKIRRELGRYGMKIWIDRQISIDKTISLML